jgi:RNA polymerase sigma-70 factor (ECF subfamily)
MGELPPPDERVIRALCTDHGPALLGYANRLTSGDHQRAEDRPTEVADPQGWEPSVIDCELDRVLNRMEVSEALEGLSPQHREVIREIYFADRSVAQASIALGVPEGTIKSRCYYALRALRVLAEQTDLLP